jgi:hypothetical protein
MTSLTIQLQDDSLLEKAARVARAQKTSVDAMIGGFLASLTDTSASEESEMEIRRKLVEELEQSFRDYSRPWGGRGYTNRDELYERG